MSETMREELDRLHAELSKLFPMSAPAEQTSMEVIFEARRLMELRERNRPSRWLRIPHE